MKRVLFLLMISFLLIGCTQKELPKEPKVVEEEREDIDESKFLENELNNIGLSLLKKFDDELTEIRYSESENSDGSKTYSVIVYFYDNISASYSYDYIDKKLIFNQLNIVLDNQEQRERAVKLGLDNFLNNIVGIDESEKNDYYKMSLENYEDYNYRYETRHLLFASNLKVFVYKVK